MFFYHDSWLIFSNFVTVGKCEVINYVALIFRGNVTFSREWVNQKSLIFGGWRKWGKNLGLQTFPLWNSLHFKTILRRKLRRSKNRKNPFGSFERAKFRWTKKSPRRISAFSSLLVWNFRLHYQKLKSHIDFTSPKLRLYFVHFLYILEFRLKYYLGEEF